MVFVMWAAVAALLGKRRLRRVNQHARRQLTIVPSEQIREEVPA
jgi:hypothetical protein